MDQIRGFLSAFVAGGKPLILDETIIYALQKNGLYFS